MRVLCSHVPAESSCPSGLKMLQVVHRCFRTFKAVSGCSKTIFGTSCADAQNHLKMFKAVQNRLKLFQEVRSCLKTSKAALVLLLGSTDPSFSVTLLRPLRSLARSRRIASCIRSRSLDCFLLFKLNFHLAFQKNSATARTYLPAVVQRRAQQINNHESS